MSAPTLFLAGLSALEVWTAAATGRAPWPAPTRSTSLRHCAEGLEDIRAFDVGRYGADSEMLDVLVPPEGSNRQSRSIRRRRALSSYPPRSFFRVSSNVMVCSPELCFAQVASVFSPIGLALFGFELCGSFAIDLRSGGLVARRALTSASRLRSYTNLLGSARGAKKARAAAALVLDCSHSPMESKVALELSTPRRLGGFGLPAPAMNKTLDFSRAPESTARVRRGDLLWERHGVVLEYDSEEEHDSKASIDRDARRRNDFVSENYRVLTVTKQQAYDLASMERIAAKLERMLGLRMRDSSAEIARKRAELHRSLYPEVDDAPRPKVVRCQLPLQ